MFHPSIKPKKFKFYVIVDPANKFLVPLATNKTVNDLIAAVKIRLRKKTGLFSQKNTNRLSTLLLDIDALTTMYWVDAQSLKPKHIYVILGGTDQLHKILNTFKSMISNSCKLKEFYWFISRSPSTVLKLGNLRPNDIEMVPNEIRQQYHRMTPFLYPGFYFNFFIAKKYIGPNHQQKRKQIELYRQQRLQSKYHLNSPNISQQQEQNTQKVSIINNINRGRYVSDKAMNEIIIHHNNNILNIESTNQLHFASKTSKASFKNENHDSLTHLIHTSETKTIHEIENGVNFHNNNNIPSYLLTDDDDNGWLYLYYSFDFKYILLLCFACRCLNRGELSQVHYVKLQESAKIRQLTDEEFGICIQKSMDLTFDHVKETIDILSKQNDKYYVNFERMIVYECLVHLAANGFEQKRLDILRICSQFGTVSQLSPVEISCIIQMFLTEYQLLNIYRHLF